MATLQQQNIHPVLSLTWDLLTDPVINPTRKARLRQDARRYQYKDQLATREELKSNLDYYETSDGFVYIVNFSRDCDNCERTWLSKIPAHVTAYELHVKQLHSGAEGLTYCDLVSEATARKFEPSFRDRNAEYYGY